MYITETFNFNEKFNNFTHHDTRRLTDMHGRAQHDPTLDSVYIYI